MSVNESNGTEVEKGDSDGKPDFQFFFGCEKQKETILS